MEKRGIEPKDTPDCTKEILQTYEKVGHMVQRHTALPDKLITNGRQNQ